MKILLIEPTLDNIPGSGPKGPEGMECQRSRGVSAQTKRRDTRVLEIRAGLYKGCHREVIFYAT